MAVHNALVIVLEVWVGRDVLGGVRRQGTGGEGVGERTRQVYKLLLHYTLC